MGLLLTCSINEKETRLYFAYDDTEIVQGFFCKLSHVSSCKSCIPLAWSRNCRDIM
jgi:hypothetical protein